MELPHRSMRRDQAARDAAVRALVTGQRDGAAPPGGAEVEHPHRAAKELWRYELWRYCRTCPIRTCCHDPGAIDRPAMADPTETSDEP
jgi:hypothetical protein